LTRDSSSTVEEEEEGRCGDVCESLGLPSPYSILLLLPLSFYISSIISSHNHLLHPRLPILIEGMPIGSLSPFQMFLLCTVWNRRSMRDDDDRTYYNCTVCFPAL
ncbi:hypothetical protein PENTCL1PPCAC_7814, partial [Pristionchus entomophagus]